jgi:hypothetical protein
MADLFGSAKCTETELLQCLEFAAKLSKLPGPLIDDDFRGFDEYSGKVKTKVDHLTIWATSENLHVVAKIRIQMAIGKLLDELPVSIELPKYLRYALIGNLLQCPTQSFWDSTSRQFKLLSVSQREDFLRMEAYQQHRGLSLDDLNQIGFTNIHPRFVFHMIPRFTDTLFPKSELPAGLAGFSSQYDILQKATEKNKNYDKSNHSWSWDRFNAFVEQLYQETGQYLGYCVEHPNLMFYAKEKELSLVTWLVRALDVPLPVAIRTARHQIFPDRHWLDSFLVQNYHSVNFQ